MLKHIIIKLPELMIDHLVIGTGINRKLNYWRWSLIFSEVS
jgi:hypothetical protein